MDDREEGEIRDACQRCGRFPCNCRRRVISVDTILKSCSKWNGNKARFDDWRDELKSYLSLSTLKDLIEEAESREPAEWRDELVDDEENNNVLYNVLLVLTTEEARTMINRGKANHGDKKDHCMQAFRILYNYVYGKRALTAAVVAQKIETRRLKGNETMEAYLAELKTRSYKVVR